MINTAACIFLIRHATPDWSRRDIPYDIPPGPALTQKGEQEARELGAFLKSAGVMKVYYSPLERATQTAQIAAGVAGIPQILKNGLAEWKSGEEKDSVHARLWPIAEASLAESFISAPVGLVTHGGPIGVLLDHFCIEADRLAQHRKMFDHSNPLPPAGVWSVRRKSIHDPWDLNLIFTPPQIS